MALRAETVEGAGMAEENKGGLSLNEVPEKRRGEPSNFFSPEGLSGQGQGPARPGERKEEEGRARMREGRGMQGAGEEGARAAETKKLDFFSFGSQSQERQGGTREEAGRDPPRELSSDNWETAGGERGGFPLGGRSEKGAGTERAMGVEGTRGEAEGLGTKTRFDGGKKIGAILAGGA